MRIVVSVQKKPAIHQLTTLTEEIRERLKFIRRERLKIRKILKGEGYWVDKRYIPKGTKKYGPYYCLRWRSPDGKLHAKYLGKDPTITLPNSHTKKLLKKLESLDREEKAILRAIQNAAEALRKGLQLKSSTNQKEACSCQ